MSLNEFWMERSWVKIHPKDSLHEVWCIGKICVRLLKILFWSMPFIRHDTKLYGLFSQNPNLSFQVCNQVDILFILNNWWKDSDLLPVCSGVLRQNFCVSGLQHASHIVQVVAARIRQPLGRSFNLYVLSSHLKFSTASMESSTGVERAQTSPGWKLKNWRGKLWCQN